MRAAFGLLAIGALAASVAGCDPKPTSAPAPPASSASPTRAPAPKPTTGSETPAMPAAPLASVATRFPAPSRLVALGDVHGDLNATRRALRLGGLIDEADRWVGGQAVLVQTGDILDRGDDEQAIIDLFVKLETEAKSAGGAVHVLSGNHELMNAMGDFRYVTQGGFADFDDAPGVDASAPSLARFPSERRARIAALGAGGVYARKLAPHPMIVVVGDSVFAHGGVLPKHVDYGIERINAEASAFMAGGPKGGARWGAEQDSPVWSRHFSQNPDDSDCQLLDKTLSKLGVKRMVVGHTVQRTIKPACDEKVWRIDVGMAAHYGGHPEVLEIAGEGVRAVR